MKTTGLWLIVACALSLPASTQEPNEGGAATTVRALERKWSEAQLHNDNRALDLIFDNGLVLVEYGRLVSKGDYLSQVRQVPAQQDQFEPEPMTVRIFGNTAIVIGSFREKQIRGGRPIIKRWRFLDTWVYNKGGWMLVAAAAAPITEQ